MTYEKGTKFLKQSRKYWIATISIILPSLNKKAGFGPFFIGRYWGALSRL